MNQVHARSAKQTAGPGGPAARPKPRAPVRPVQRKRGGCSCGGGCPACQAEKRAESEADRVADDILANRPAGAVTAAPPPVQASEGPGGLTPGPVPHPGPGRPLAGPARGFFEGRFGRDFSGVRIHDGPGAHASAMAINARAYTSGSDIVFARGEFAPGTRRGDHLLAHELTHVIQQRQGLASVQRVPADDEIGGRRFGHQDAPDIIAFDFGSATIHPDEKAKIPGAVKLSMPDIRIKGFRSRDEPASLAGDRADAVETEIAAGTSGANTVTQPEPTSFQDQVDFRRFRVAAILKDTVSSATAVCPSGSAQYHDPCLAPPAGAVDIPAAFASARADIASTVSALEQFKGDPSANPATGAKLDKFFGPGADVNKLITHYKRIGFQTGRVAKKDIGKNKHKRPGYRCATECNNDCSDARAVTKGDRGACRVTICPSTWNGNTDEAVTTLIHEVSHCTGNVGRFGGGTDDVIYEKEKAIPFLTTRERMRSADLFALFVHELLHGGPDTILPTVTDDVSKLAGADQAFFEEALARLAKWLQASGDQLRSLFDATIEAKKKGWAPIWGERLYKVIFRQFGTDFSLTNPRRKMTDTDVNAIAAIADRVTVLSSFVDGSTILAKQNLLTKWSASSSLPGILPGETVDIDTLHLKPKGMEKAVLELLRVLLDAAPHVSAKMAPKYFKVINWIRKDAGIGP